MGKVMKDLAPDFGLAGVVKGVFVRGGYDFVDEELAFACLEEGGWV
jgi:hypothetical protein